MFKELDGDAGIHAGEGYSGGAAQAPSLSHAQALPDAALVESPPLPRLEANRIEQEPAPLPWRARLDKWKHDIEAWCHNVELAPDLAADIGSPRWYRGLATLFGLSAAAVAFWPSFSAVEAATPIPFNDRIRDEFRSQTIAPLALGGDSGRKMGASPLVHPLARVPERPMIQLVSTLGQGDSLQRMLQRAGVGSSDISQVSELVARAVPPGEIASGTQFDITLGKRPAEGAPRALDELAFRARFDLDLAIERNDGALTLVRHPIAVDETPLRIRGTVGSSLYRSARNAGAPVAAIQSYLRAVDKYLSLESDVTSGDAFDLILAYKRSAKGERQVGELLYAGVERDGKPRLQLMRWGKDGQMFAASGIGETRSAPIGMPVPGRITSRYGMRRHPILGYKRMHAGIDFGAGYGTPIHAVSEGTITYAGRHGGHGNYVRINHGGGIGTGYGHMSRIAVKNGARVRAGQVIGYVGSTGLSTGPHLHFEAYRAGRTVDPMSIRFVSRPQLDGKERGEFKRRMNALLAVEPGAALANFATREEQLAEAEREIDRLAPKKIG
ncbi:M23 family metallopeptidase [Novosphingobium endophyticum]|uniref:M23 family metallopeptidase n=1 Tax=Novosphingobium endophyticum TaxID=1955250 RepID=UPI001E47E765|nr:M23 family metallopeptidase [Novosphingobium endophyticum]